MKKICVIGLGKMGRAIFEGLEKAGFEVVGIGRDEGYEKCVSADMVIIAVKPQQFVELAESFKISGKLVLSIMAGISLAKLKKNLGENDFVRLMPNVALKIGRSATGWYAESGVRVRYKDVIEKILQLFGEGFCLEEENMIDAFTAVAGSGPAYFYKFVSALARGGVELGLDKEVSERVAKQTFVGAAGMVGVDFEVGMDELIGRVASKGGTTEAALNQMDLENFDKTVIESVKTAYKRAKELND